MKGRLKSYATRRGCTDKIALDCRALHMKAPRRQIGEMIYRRELSPEVVQKQCCAVLEVVRAKSTDIWSVALESGAGP